MQVNWYLQHLAVLIRMQYAKVWLPVQKCLLMLYGTFLICRLILMILVVSMKALSELTARVEKAVLPLFWKTVTDFLFQSLCILLLVRLSRKPLIRRSVNCRLLKFTNVFADSGLTEKSLLQSLIWQKPTLKVRRVLNQRKLLPVAV